MTFNQIRLIASLTYKNIITVPINRWLIGAFLALICFASITAYFQNSQHAKAAAQYSQDVRERWENNPDKHPHRMAHYGYIAFRTKSPLSFFDHGMDSYFGNAVFLEAHRINPINFSQASLSSDLLRFGELSSGLILQLLLPLLLFFWGYALISKEREQGTLKLLFAQGVNWETLIIGKTVGLFISALFLLLPTFLISAVLLFVSPADGSAVLSWATMVLSYLLYAFILASIAVWVSAYSATSKAALTKLIACWLCFTLILPKTTQAIGEYIYPIPSKVAFDKTVEKEILKQGDSHNPDDPHFKAIKDKLLQKYKVKSTKELPFNYSGYIMKEGEKLSTLTYRAHHKKLIDTYRKQTQLIAYSGLINPFIALKKVSMGLAGTDLEAYLSFGNAAETYRYDLAQGMNDLQIEHVSNYVKSSADKKAAISHQHWVDFPTFSHQLPTYSQTLDAISWSLLCLLTWCFGCLLCASYFTSTLKKI